MAIMIIKLMQINPNQIVTPKKTDRNPQSKEEDNQQQTRPGYEYSLCHIGGISCSCHYTIT